MIDINEFKNDIYNILNIEEYKTTVKLFSEDMLSTVLPEKSEWIYVSPINMIIKFPKKNISSLNELNVYITQLQSFNKNKIIKNILTNIKKIANNYGVLVSIRNYYNKQGKKQFIDLITAYIEGEKDD